MDAKFQALLFSEQMDIIRKNGWKVVIQSPDQVFILVGDAMKPMSFTDIAELAGYPDLLEFKSRIPLGGKTVEQLIGEGAIYPEVQMAQITQIDYDALVARIGALEAGAGIDTSDFVKVNKITEVMNAFAALRAQVNSIQAAPLPTPPVVSPQPAAMPSSATVWGSGTPLPQASTSGNPFDVFARHI